MRQLFAFTKKEFMESARTGKLPVLFIIFVLFGIMNPAIAKLMPWMMEAFSESMSEAGMVFSGTTEVNAMTSWLQFYKNIPLALIIFLLMTSSTLTAEYQKGTLINILTKGIFRWKVIFSKALSCMLLWTAVYWLCFGVTYAYNFYYWDNSIAFDLIPAACCVYLFGLWLISLILLTSSLFHTNSAVLAASGGIFLVSYLIGFLPGIQKFLPVQLLASSSILSGSAAVSDYTFAIWTTGLLTVFALVLSVICFNRKAI